MANGLADPLQSLTVEIPADHRRAVAGAIYAAAAHLDVRLNKLPPANRRRREELVRQARELRELASEIQP